MLPFPGNVCAGMQHVSVGILNMKCVIGGGCLIKGEWACTEGAQGRAGACAWPIYKRDKVELGQNRVSGMNMCTAKVL